MVQFSGTFSFYICRMYTMYRFASSPGELVCEKSARDVPKPSRSQTERSAALGPNFAFGYQSRSSLKCQELPQNILFLLLLVLHGSPRVHPRVSMSVRACSEAHERGLDTGSQRSSKHSSDDPSSATSSALISTRSKSSLLSGMNPSSSSGQENS